VAEEDAQRLGDGEDELAVREVEKEVLVEVVSEQEGALLGAGRAEVESFARKRSEIFTTGGTVQVVDGRWAHSSSWYRYFCSKP
jgi:hypothetical protein